MWPIKSQLAQNDQLEIAKSLKTNPQQLAIKCSETMSIINILPQIKISAFESIAGIYFYDQARNIIHQSQNNFNQAIIPKLHKAMQYKSLHATEYYIYYMQHILETNSSQQIQNETITNIITKATFSAQTHGTPGYILLAKFYIWCYKNIETDTNTKQDYYARGLAALSTAFAVKGDSANSIHNAAHYHADMNQDNPEDFYVILDSITSIKSQQELMTYYSSLAKNGTADQEVNAPSIGFLQGCWRLL